MVLRINHIVLSIILSLITLGSYSQVMDDAYYSLLMSYHSLNTDSLNKELRIQKIYKNGVSLAKKEQKPIFLYFTGYALANGRIFETSIYKDQELFNLLKDNFVNIWLYLDDKRYGNKWSEIQTNTFKTNHQPCAYILSPNEKMQSMPLDLETIRLKLLKKEVVDFLNKENK